MVGRPKKENMEKNYPFTVEEGVKTPTLVGNKTWNLYAPKDIELLIGNIPVSMGITLDEGLDGIVLPAQENAVFGIMGENNVRIDNSVNVVPIAASRSIYCIISVTTNNLVTEQTTMGTRRRFCRIPKGTLLCNLTIL